MNHSLTRGIGSLLLVSGIFLFSNFGSSIPNQLKQKSLFNGKDLRGWDTYVGPAYDTVQKKFVGKPVGLNVDPDWIFDVVKEDGKPAIRISGEKFGGISTQQSFANYHLQLEFKWGKLKWHPKRNSKMDSGLLYHAVGKQGADGGFWMRSQELIRYNNRIHSYGQTDFFENLNGSLRCSHCSAWMG